MNNVFLRYILEFAVIIPGAVYSLLPVQKKNSLLPGDDKDMVTARRNFLETGLYAPFKDVLCGIVQEAVEGNASPLVVDAGCGEGYYTGGVWQALQEICEAPKLCAFDISKFAVKAAAGRYKGIDFAVAAAAVQVVILFPARRIQPGDALPGAIHYLRILRQGIAVGVPEIAQQ